MIFKIVFELPVAILSERRALYLFVPLFNQALLFFNLGSLTLKYLINGILLNSSCVYFIFSVVCVLSFTKTFYSEPLEYHVYNKNVLIVHGDYDVFFYQWQKLVQKRPYVFFMLAILQYLGC